MILTSTASNILDEDTTVFCTQSRISATSGLHSWSLWLCHTTVRHQDLSLYFEHLRHPQLNSGLLFQLLDALILFIIGQDVLKESKDARENYFNLQKKAELVE